MNLENIYNHLKHYNSEINISNQLNLEIYDVLLLDGNATDFKSSLLYIFKASEVSEPVLRNLPTNSLCICDIPINSDSNLFKSKNVIFVKNAVDTLKLYNEVEGCLQYYYKLIYNSTRLLDLSTAGKGIQYIVNRGFEIFGNPILLTDISFKLIACTQDFEIDDPLWNDITKNGHASYEIYRLVKNSGFLKKAYNSQVCFNTRFGNSKYEWNSIIVVSQKNIIGHLSLINYVKPHEDIDKELITLMSKIISSEMEKNAHYTQTKGKMYECFIQDLIEGKINTERLVRDKMRYLNLNLKKFIFLLKISIKPGITGKYNLPFFRDTLESIIKMSKSMLYEDSIILILSRNSSIALDGDENDTLINFLNENNMIAGLSRHFFNISDIKQYYEQCTIAMEIGNHLDEGKKLYVYDDYALYHLINSSGSKIASTVCHPAVLELIEHDKLSKTDYCRTLYVYLLNNSNLTKAAKHLFIHRNTMEYRIHKIEELLKLDINDSDNALILYLSLKMIKYEMIKFNSKNDSKKDVLF